MSGDPSGRACRVRRRASRLLVSASGRACRYFCVVVSCGRPIRSTPDFRSDPPARSQDASAWCVDGGRDDQRMLGGKGGEGGVGLVGRLCPCLARDHGGELGVQDLAHRPSLEGGDDVRLRAPHRLYVRAGRVHRSSDRRRGRATSPTMNLDQGAPRLRMHPVRPSWQRPRETPPTRSMRFSFLGCRGQLGLELAPRRDDPRQDAPGRQEQVAHFRDADRVDHLGAVAV